MLSKSAVLIFALPYLSAGRGLSVNVERRGALQSRAAVVIPTNCTLPTDINNYLGSNCGDRFDPECPALLKCTEQPSGSNYPYKCDLNQENINRFCEEGKPCSGPQDCSATLCRSSGKCSSKNAYLGQKCKEDVDCYKGSTFLFCNKETTLCDKRAGQYGAPCKADSECTEGRACVKDTFNGGKYSCFFAPRAGETGFACKEDADCKKPATCSGERLGNKACAIPERTCKAIGLPCYSAGSCCEPLSCKSTELFFVFQCQN